MRHAALLILLAAATSPRGAAAQDAPTQPGPPVAGYGSTDGYITDSWRTGRAGDNRDGSRVWWYVPSVLKGGDRAPVVVYLHGWSAYLPQYYAARIEHLVRQGYIVIYPQYQKSGVIGLFTDSDQTVFLSRAVSAVDTALAELGEVADRDQLVVAGHSLGGLLTFCWQWGGGSSPQAILMENAELDSANAPIPVEITILDWNECAPAVDVPAYFVTGEDDVFYPESVTAWGMLTLSPYAEVFLARTDAHGEPPVLANHGAPLAGTSADALDWRFYFSALDAVADGDRQLSFDMGAWSDGVPVRPIERLLP